MASPQRQQGSPLLALRAAQQVRTSKEYEALRAGPAVPDRPGRRRHLACPSLMRPPFRTPDLLTEGEKLLFKDLREHNASLDSKESRRWRCPLGSTGRDAL